MNEKKEGYWFCQICSETFPSNTFATKHVEEKHKPNTLIEFHEIKRKVLTLMDLFILKSFLHNSYTCSQLFSGFDKESFRITLNNIESLRKRLDTLINSGYLIKECGNPIIYRLNEMRRVEIVTRIEEIKFVV